MSMYDIIVRYPRIDYSEMPRRWANNLPVCHDRNATGIIPAPVEPWLIKLLQRVLPMIPEADAEVRAGVEGFIGQESQHFRRNTFHRS